MSALEATKSLVCRPSAWEKIAHRQHTSHFLRPIIRLHSFIVFTYIQIITIIYNEINKIDLNKFSNLVHISSLDTRYFLTISIYFSFIYLWFSFECCCSITTHCFLSNTTLHPHDPHDPHVRSQIRSNNTISLVRRQKLTVLKKIIYLRFIYIYIMCGYCFCSL